MDVNKFLEECATNMKKITNKDEKAKAEGKLVGRYIAESFADGQAIYVITKELEVWVEIKVCTGIGDDWVIPYWGEKARIDKAYALRNINRRDSIEKLFKGEDKNV